MAAAPGGNVKILFAIIITLMILAAIVLPWPLSGEKWTDDLKFQLGGKRDEYAIYLAMRVLWPSWAERLHMDWWHRPPDPPLELEGL
jgi:hypothetical protein